MTGVSSVATVCLFRPRCPNLKPAHAAARCRTPPALSATGDQGLLVHVYIVLLGAWTSPGGFWEVHHFFGGDKPWRPVTRCFRYFDFLEHPAFARRPSEERTPCQRLLWGRHACLNPNNSWAAAAETCRRCKRQGQKSSCTRPPRCSNHLRWAVF